MCTQLRASGWFTYIYYPSQQTSIVCHLTVADLEIGSAPKIFASATPTSGHVVVPCTSCALKNCNVL